MEKNELIYFAQFFQLFFSDVLKFEEVKRTLYSPSLFHNETWINNGDPRLMAQAKSLRVISEAGEWDSLCQVIKKKVKREMLFFLHILTWTFLEG